MDRLEVQIMRNSRSIAKISYKEAVLPSFNMPVHGLCKGSLVYLLADNEPVIDRLSSIDNNLHLPSPETFA